MQDSVPVKEQGSRLAPRDPHGTRRLPLVVHVLAMGTFLMLTTEFVVAGILPDIAGDIGVSLSRSGLLITVFAIGTVVGAPLMAMLTLRIHHRLTLMSSRPSSRPVTSWWP